MWCSTGLLFFNGMFNNLFLYYIHRLCRYKYTISSHFFFIFIYNAIDITNKKKSKYFAAFLKGYTYETLKFHPMKYEYI